MTTIYRLSYSYKGEERNVYYNTIENAEREAQNISRWAEPHYAGIYPCVPDADGQFSFAAYGGTGIHYFYGEKS